MIKKIQQFFKKRRQKALNYFVHIPKTAGTSFIVLLDRFYPAKKIFPHQLWRETKSIDVVKNQEYDLFRGHFGGGGVAVLTDRPIEYFTILRHPDALAQSTFHYVLREKNTKVHQLVKDLNMDFKAFLHHPTTVPLVMNRMVRNISFDFTDDPAAQEVFLSAETIDYLKSVIKQQKPAISDDQRLARALTFIRECRWFGLLEKFDESLQLLCYEMNWPPIGKSQKLNTRKNSQPYSAAEAKLLREINQQDLQFYAYAEEVFAQRTTDMLQHLNVLRKHEQQSIDELIDLNYQKQHAKSLGGNLSGQLNYGFDQMLLGSQWHRRELMHPEKQYFRWTGPGQHASIDFWLQAQNYVVSIRIINATSEAMLNQLQIEINGQPVKWQTSDVGLVRVLSFSCSKDHIKSNGLARLGIICEPMLSHQKAFGSNDERLVGIAVHWIKFEREN